MPWTARHRTRKERIIERTLKVLEANPHGITARDIVGALWDINRDDNPREQRSRTVRTHDVPCPTTLGNWLKSHPLVRSEKASNGAKAYYLRD